MADSSLDPTKQASFDKALAALKAKEAELEQVIAGARQGVAELKAASQAAVAETQAQAQRLAEVKPILTGPGTVKETIATVKTLAAVEADVNKLLEQQIALRKEAATAAGQQLGAATGGAAGAASRAGALPPIVGQAAGAPKVSTEPGTAKAAREAEKAAERARMLAQAQIGAAEGTGALEAAQQKYVLSATQVDNVLQRHGALTTEFIQAAARGQVTLREFGDQIGQTVGKFAGWTFAAAAVYGVLGAVTELGKGAIDGQNAVQNLSRTVEGIDRSAAGQAIVKLAHDTNTSMKEAGESAFLFSRTFHSVSDATYVAGLALRAYKLDGVTVTDQVKAMTAIHQQFKISAQGMGPVWGLLSAGQRDFNARVNEMVPALGGSMTAIKNAGGDLIDYVKILQIALRTTQLSGAQLATAFRRAPTFLNRPVSQAGLKALGFDPKQAINEFTDFFQEVMKRAPKMSGGDRRKLFTYIFGPQQGQRVAGLSTVDPALLKKIMGQSVTSADPLLEEFSRLLGTPQEKLKAIVNDVQQLGSELGQSGVLGPLSEMVSLLGAGLHTTDQILSLWSALPGFMKEAAGYLAMFGAARALASKFNLGIPLIGPKPEATLGKQIGSGLGAEQAFYQEQYASSVRTAATATLTAKQAQVARNEAVAAQGAQANAATEEQVIISERVFQDALVRQQAAVARMAAMQEETVAIQERINTFNAGINEGLGAEAALAAAGGQYRYNTLERGQKAAITMPVVPVGGAAEVPSGATQKVQQEAERTAVAAAEQSKFAAAMGVAGANMRGAAEKIPFAVKAIDESTIRLANMRAGTLGLVTKLGGWLPSLIGLSLVIGQFSNVTDELDQGYKDMMAAVDTAAVSFKQAKRDAVTAQQKVNDQLTRELQGPAAGIPILGGALQAVSENAVVNRVLDLAGAFSGSEKGQKQLDATKAYDKVFNQWLNDAEDGMGTFAKSAGGRETFYARLNAVKTAAQKWAGKDPLSKSALKTLDAATQSVYQTFQASLSVLPVDANDPFAQFRSLDLATNAKNMTFLADKAKVYGTTPDMLAQLAGAWTYIATTYAGRGDSKSLQLIDQSRTAAFGAVQQSVQDLLDAAKVAGTPQEYSADVTAATKKVHDFEALLGADFKKQSDAAGRDLAAYRTMAGLVRRGQGSRAKLAAAYKKYLTDLGNLQALAAADTSLKAQLDTLLGTIEQARTGYSAPIDKTKMLGDIAKAQASGDPARQALIDENTAGQEKKDAQTEKDRAQAKLDLINAENAYNQAVQDAADALGAFRSAQDLNPITKAAQDVLNATQDVRNAVTHGGRGTKAYWDAQTKLLQAQQSGDQAQQDLSQSRYALAAAQTQDPLQQALLHMQGAAQAAAFAAQTQGRDSKAYIDAMATYATDEQAYSQALSDRNDARLKMLEAKTTDPLKQAQIELRIAAAAVQRAASTAGVGSKPYDDAMANYYSAQQKVVAAKVSQSEDDIQFHLQMGDISVQTAINEYEALLHMHNLTKQTRRQILEQIKQWKDQGSSSFSALDLGSLRLPTPYEIRRGLLGAQGGMTVRQTNTVHVNVTDPGSVNQVGVVLDRYVGGTGKAIARASGTR